MTGLAGEHTPEARVGGSEAEAEAARGREWHSRPLCAMGRGAAGGGVRSTRERRPPAAFDAQVVADTACRHGGDAAAGKANSYQLTAV